ncbi:uncharacterized protein LOC108626099 [Ceratina calcarata]|uniref:Uncharacterized protein LOC108626099 n=1 Tax=Ceratina calcarata TaxID=156304 RepID=A0AAJ7J1S8_9HYME|nr:uncharacterized protein LOC108626099 [Ceratina calcarata]
MNVSTSTTDDLEDARSKGDLPRSERIEQLMLEERRLSEANEKIRKQLKHYEKRYEKALKKKVKAMKMHLEDGQQKLEVIKQRCQELDKALDANPYKVGRARKTGKQPKVNKSVIKVRTMKPKQFRQTTLPITKQIKIKISRNEGNREMHFVNESNSTGNGPLSRNAFTDLVKIVQPVTVNTRECRIMLQRLTEEQMKLYKNQKQPDQTPKKRKRQTPQKVNEDRLSIIQPKWHIKIPKSVFEESQREIVDTSLDPVTGSNDTI